MFQGAYHAAPNSTLLPFCAKSPLLAIGVPLFIGIPETLFVVAPVLESPSK